MIDEATNKTRSEAFQIFGMLWSLLWRSMVYFPVALIRLALVTGVLYGFVLLCAWTITYAIIREWLSFALCLLGVGASVAVARFIRHRLLRRAAEPLEIDAPQSGVVPL